MYVFFFYLLVFPSDLFTATNWDDDDVNTYFTIKNDENAFQWASNYVSQKRDGEKKMSEILSSLWQMSQF